MPKRPKGGRGPANNEDDDSGTGLFFLMSILICIIVPWTLAVVWKLLTPGRSEIAKAFPSTTESGQRVRHSQTAAMVAKRDAQIQYWKSRRRFFTWGFVIRLGILVLLWCWVIYIMVQIQAVMATSALYKNFDPFEVMGIASGSSMAEIKKQYRTMSRKLHPDRNTAADATEKFILLKKAYECLTDETAKRNFELYGNPDGPTRMELGVALPVFSQENQGAVLLAFVFVFILGLPCAAILLVKCSGSSKTARGVFIETEESIQACMAAKKSIDEITIRDVVAQSKETSGSTGGDSTSPEELQAVAELWKQFGNSKKKNEVDSSHLKGEMLLQAHLQRHTSHLTVPSLSANLEELLPQWCLVARDCAEFAWTAEALIAAVRVHRCLIQGLDPAKQANDASNLLLQAPHFSAERIKLWRKGKNKSAGLLTFLELPADARQTSLKDVGFEEQELLDVEDFVTAVPQLKVKDAQVICDAYTDLDDIEGVEKRPPEEIRVGDVATFKLTLDRQNLRDDQAAGCVHCPLFPRPVHEAWWVALSLDTKKDGKAKWRRKRIDDPSKFVEIVIRFPVEREGKHRCKVQLVSEAYDGIDIEHEVSFQALKEKEPEPAGSDDEHKYEDSDGDEGASE